jgi:hypothetical protein
MLVAHLIREYLDFYRMDYTMSVYLPEVCIQNTDAIQRDDLSKKAGIKPSHLHESSVPLLV